MIELRLAAYFEIEQALQVLLEGGFGIDEDNYGLIPLFYAAKNGHEAIVKMLLERC